MSTLSLPVLYTFRRCPYAMRARLAILASGTRVQLREVVLRNKPAALIEASPKATVPVLVLPDGEVIEQSLDIMHWALRSQDPWGWLPTTPQAEQKTAALIHQCDVDFKPLLDRYKYPNRFGLADGLVHQAHGAVFLTQLDQHLNDSPFLHGLHWGMADTALAPFVRQFAHTDKAWFTAQNWPALAQWLQAFESSETFTHCMEAHAPWLEGDAPLIFPIQ
ncbi:glutathione S-transferase [Rhodoferax sp.]|uniref:glutathione S-transferase n=1 Tax=Rhodoferax sp. TaxID=50421 RepID=UPI0025E51521|nr:glutathione S-transferase [Rhodoferax sp.]